MLRVQAPHVTFAPQMLPAAALHAMVSVVSTEPGTHAPVPAHVPAPHERVAAPTQKPNGTMHAPSVQVRHGAPVGRMSTEPIKLDAGVVTIVRDMHAPALQTRLVVLTVTAPPREQLMPVGMQSPRVSTVGPHAVPSVVRLQGVVVVSATHAPPSQRKLVVALLPVVAQVSANVQVPTIGAGQSEAVAHAPHASLASSQKGHVSRPPVQLPALQASPMVQKRPSSHAFVLGRCSHPAEPQPSSVHGLPSSHAIGSQTAPSGSGTSGRGASVSGTSADGASIEPTSRSMIGLRASEHAPSERTNESKPRRSMGAMLPHAARPAHPRFPPLAAMLSAAP